MNKIKLENKNSRINTTSTNNIKYITLLLYNHIKLEN